MPKILAFKSCWYPNLGRSSYGWIDISAQSEKLTGCSPVTKKKVRLPKKSKFSFFILVLICFILLLIYSVQLTTRSTLHKVLKNISVLRHGHLGGREPVMTVGRKVLRLWVTGSHTTPATGTPTELSPMHFFILFISCMVLLGIV
jgi:flagellar biogenesis protein FliO